jgi:cytochrome oxidase assembly protein ShyY1
MKRFLGLTALALVLIALCLQAARWQFHRYEIRHARNEIIKENISKSIDESALSRVTTDPSSIAWKKIELRGHFDPTKEILVRNRYHYENFGYGIVTLFISDSGKRYWVDRGWVKAGKDATTPPVTQPVTTEENRIVARVRVENIEKQVGGTLFATAQNSGASVLERWNGSASVATEPVYFDLISSDREGFTPTAPTELPEISDGPHLAYTFQWILFAILIAFGWFLVVREDKRIQSAKA